MDRYRLGRRGGGGFEALGKETKEETMGKECA
jgi:hypothetical protein